MPRVQSYGQPQVRSAPIPGVRKQAHETFESEGGAIAEAQAGVGASIARVGLVGYSQIQQAERDRADDIANLKTVDQYNQVEHGLLYDEKTGILNKRGLEPHDQRQAYLDSFDESASAIGAGAKTAKQQLFAEQQRIQRRSNLSDRIDAHAVASMDAYEGDQFKATMQSSVNAAIAAGMDDPKRIKQEFDYQAAAIATHGARVGLAPEAQVGFRDELRAKVHSGVIDQLLAQGKDQNAKHYFEETRDEIAKGDPQAIARIENALNEGTTLAEAQRQSDTILAATRTPADARAAAKAITDPKVRQTTLELVEHELQVKEQQQRDAHEQLTLKGLNTVEQTGRWSSIPANEWAQYTVGERASIKEYLRQKADGGVKTDPSVYAALVNMASSSDPDVRKAFQSLNPVTLLDKLSPSDYQEMVRLMASSRKGDQGAVDNALTDTKNQNAMVDEALSAMGLPPNPIEPGKTDHDPVQYARINQFRRAVREAAARVAGAQKKPVTDDQLQSIVDELRTRTGKRVIATHALWPDTTADAYAFEEAQAQADDVKDIPAGERRRIEEALRGESIPVTDGAVLKYFNLLLQRTRKDR